MNPITDFYRIRAELRITMYLWLCLGIIYIISGLSFEYASSGKNKPIGYALSLWYIGICLTLNGLLSTAWIIHLHKNKHFEYSQQFVNFEMEKLQRTYENKTMFERLKSKFNVNNDEDTTHTQIESLSNTPRYNNKLEVANPTESTINKDDNFKLESIEEGNNAIDFTKSKSNDTDFIRKESIFSNSSNQTSKTENAEQIFQSFPLREILVNEEGFRCMMQHMTSEFSVENLLFLVEVVRYKYAKNGFKHLEMYCTADDYNDKNNEDKEYNNDKSNTQSLVWYMPLPDSLIKDVVKPPSHYHSSSIQVKINEDSTTIPHATASHKDVLDINGRKITTDDDDENGEIKENDKKRPDSPTKSMLKKHLKFQTPTITKPNIRTKKSRSRTRSNQSFNPLFHKNISVEIDQNFDSNINEIKQWEDAQIAWGSLSHAIMIYSKYVKLGSLFEINISHRLRNELKKKFIEYKKFFMDNEENLIDEKLREIMCGDDKYNDNIKIFIKFPQKRKELEHIFDKAAKQIEALMNDSYLRFRQTQIYHRLLKQLVKYKQKQKQKKK